MDLILRALKIKSTEKQKEVCSIKQIEEPQSIKQIEEPQSIKQISNFIEDLSPEEFWQMIATDRIYVSRRG